MDLVMMMIDFDFEIIVFQLRMLSLFPHESKKYRKCIQSLILSHKTLIITMNV
jgi:hypothetical protein